MLSLGSDREKVLPLNIYSVFVENSTLTLCESKLFKFLGSHVADGSPKWLKFDTLVSTLLDLGSVFPEATARALALIRHVWITGLLFDWLN